MLQLKNISKTYQTEHLTQQALDQVSLSLRDREFVAILGPSGSGKTTLLNIIGGLDRYTTGELVINGRSTRDYKDRDWDHYRNHSIGFVFQNYNLIAHQSVQANVELALTIGGISAEEKKARASRALEDVGLLEHARKLPTQLSGGQMQRVAIARALVNDPDIILADEPTGALDSDTSIQVMELLKEAAKDRLVVMVTHNNELAEAYATRIIRIRDGKIISDSDPFAPAEVRHSGAGAVKRAAMSFFTALSLSFANLRSKKGRTILVSLAGSIGIIGIALIIAITNGANGFIRATEESTIVQYPVQVLSTGINISNYMSMFGASSSSDAENPDGNVRENQIVHQYANGLTRNDLRSFKEYIDSGESGIDTAARAIEYSYNLTPQIYREENGSIRRINPEQCLDILGVEFTDISLINLIAFYELPRNAFLYEDLYEVAAGHWPENRNECVVVLADDGSITDTALYALGLKDSTELDDIVRSLISNENVPMEETVTEWTAEDFMGIEFKVIPAGRLYSWDPDLELWTTVNDKNKLRKLYDSAEPLTVSGVIRKKADAENSSLECGIYYTPALEDYLMSLSSDNAAAMAQIAQPDLNIFTGRAFGESSDASEINLMDLVKMDEESLQEAFSVDLEDLLDQDAAIPELDLTDLGELDLSSYFDAGEMAGGLNLPEADMSSILGTVRFDFSAERFLQLFRELAEDFRTNAEELQLIDPERVITLLQTYMQSDAVAELTDSLIRGIVARAAQSVPTYSIPQETGNGETGENPEDTPSDSPVPDEGAADPDSGSDVPARTGLIDPDELIENLQITGQELADYAAEISAGFASYAGEELQPDADAFVTSFTDYLNSDGAQRILRNFAANSIDTSEMERMLVSRISETMGALAEQIGTRVSAAVEGAMTAILPVVAERITTQLQETMGNMTEQLQEVLTFDPATFADAVQLTLTESQLMDWISSLISGTSDTYVTNLEKLGYAVPEDPYSITIYPKDFDSKTAIINSINRYNESMQESGQEEKVLSYSDFSGALLSSVSQILNAVSTVLIALVAISLVVSSIMIGVITNISVLERRKEIGILRSLGASKKNIADVFNAETFITGLLSGLIGVGISLLLLIPINWLLHEVFGHPDINGYLDPLSAFLLIALSVILDVISGLIPARKASRSDPVTALRSE